MFSHTILILNIFHGINPNHLIQLIYPIQIQRIWTAQLFRCFAVTQLPLALLLGLTSWTNAMFSNFQGGFSNPWTFHNIAGLRLYDAAGIYKEPWSWLWQRKRGPQHAEVPGHCQWIECWTIMLCPACFSRTTNCSPLFCTLLCSRVLQWECVSPMGSSGPSGPPIHVPPRSEATKWRTGNDDNDGGIDLASCRVWWRATNGPSSRHNMAQVSSAFAKTINKKQ